MMNEKPVERRAFLNGTKWNEFYVCNIKKTKNPLKEYSYKRI